MITYEVHLNGKVLTIAGGPDLCVLSVTLAAVGELGAAQAGSEDVEMDLHVGGLKAPEGDSAHEAVHWVEQSPLRVGDEIVIRIKQARVADPVARQGYEPVLEEEERTAFDRARDLYFRLRHKYSADPFGN
jgi:hypothetical protein